MWIQSVPYKKCVFPDVKTWAGGRAKDDDDDDDGNVRGE